MMKQKIADLSETKNAFSIKWAFGYAVDWNFDAIEATEPEEIESILDYIYKRNDDLLQVAVLYEFEDSKACHIMEIPEIVWMRKELLEPIKNNEPARYFDSHCSCDFEFVSEVIDAQYIRLTITDKNTENDPIVKFDHVISKEEFLSETDRVFKEIYAATDKLIEDYSHRHNLSAAHKELLKTRLYEWTPKLATDRIE